MALLASREAIFVRDDEGDVGVELGEESRELQVWLAKTELVHWQLVHA